MIVGIPKEIMHDEARVAAIPDTVKKMVAAGMTVLFEKGAGEGSHYHDKDYLAAGATILEDCEEIFAKSDVILKVKEPLFNEEKGKHDAQRSIYYYVHSPRVSRKPQDGQRYGGGWRYRSYP